MAGALRRWLYRFRLSKTLKVLLLLVLAIPFVLHLRMSMHKTSPVNQPQLQDPLLETHHQLVSYEDHDLNEKEQRREGPGERGQAVLLHGEELKKSLLFLNQNGFNTYISDMIALDRSVADIRYPECKTLRYLSPLPSVSVIIPFFEENWNALLRTVYSSLIRSPKGQIKEFILVDDGSSRPYLKSKLDAYVSEKFPDGLVKVIRSPKREGLIMARIRGARAASGEILVFLDSHCEPNPNWLPPLVDPIAKDYRTVTCPFIDVIDADNFEYRAQDEGARGAFDWELYYKRLPKLERDNQSPEKPFDSPVMAGGLFAISAKWFWELGGYDPGLQIWGGEQYELSFKIWMCGGRMIDIPCSRIGHIYRKHPTNFPNAGVVDFLGRNYKRVAEVWMDEYKEYIYKRRPHYRAIDPGNLTEQHAIRKRLNCKSFRWFMTEIAFDLVKKYPLIEPIPAAVGDIRSAVDQTMCIDALGASQTVPIKLNKCVRGGDNQNGRQNFEFSFHEDIRPVKLTICLDLPHAREHASIVMYECHGSHGNQHWAVEPVNNNGQNPIRLRHVISNHCLEADLLKRSVVARPCNPESEVQRWSWQILQFEAAKNSRKEAGL